jgi:hypothetical protein
VGAIVTATSEVRRRARPFLLSRTAPDLRRVTPYDGSIELLRSTGLSLYYAVLRIGAHHYFHIGEIASLRTRSGESIGDYPRDTEQCLD